jgi:hypothetical protein
MRPRAHSTSSAIPVSATAPTTVSELGAPLNVIDAGATITTKQGHTLANMCQDLSFSMALFDRKEWALMLRVLGGLGAANLEFED